MSSDEKMESERLVVRCRGLPWSTTVDEIVNFFTGVEFKEGKESCHLTLTREGRPSGEAYIEVASQEDLDKALEMDKKHCGPFIEESSGYVRQDELSVAVCYFPLFIFIITRYALFM